MNPETKLILEEMRKSISDHDLKWDQRFSDQESCLTRQIQDSEKTQDARVVTLETKQDARFSDLEKFAASFDEWRPDIEGTVGDIHLEVKKLSLGWGRASVDNPLDTSGVLAPAPNAGPLPASFLTTPVVGPGLAHQYRESGPGVVTTLVHSPVKGEHLIFPPPNPVHKFPSADTHMSESDPAQVGGIGHDHNKIPKVDFPKFDGDQPKLWLSNCIDYF
jgi:hypothetical protein